MSRLWCGPLGRRRTSRYAAAFLVAVLATVVVAHGALADSGESTGRIYNPKRTRTSKTGAERGRDMKRPPVPDPRDHQQLRSTAEVPSPEPRARGGSGYARKGKYFYAEPTPPTLTRRTNERAHATIPSPEPPPRRRSAALR